MNVAVVGAGAAGLAAAWSAARLGARVTVFRAGAGATALYSGVLDDAPLGGEGLSVSSVDSHVLALTTAVDAWSVGSEARTIATDAGVVRSARGIDPALLDLAPLAGKDIAVVRSEWLAYDAASLARALAASDWARESRTRFRTVDVPLVKREERHVNPYDLARKHDDPDRLLALGRALRAVPDPPEAWLFGPCLGTRPGAADRLSEMAGRRCGETTSPPGGPAGARFEVAADELLSAIVDLRRQRVAKVERRGDRWQLNGPEGETTDADRVVLAHGGLAAGGVVLAGGAGGSATWFRSGIEVPAYAGLDGKILDGASSQYGVDVHALGLSMLERVGLFADGMRVPGQEGLFVAGAARADEPRTVLRAVATGIEAGRLAAAPGASSVIG